MSADRDLGLHWVDPLLPSPATEDLPTPASGIHLDSLPAFLSAPLPSSIARTLHSIRIFTLPHPSLTIDQLLSTLHLPPRLIPDAAALWKFDSTVGERMAHVAYQSRRRRKEAIEVLREAGVKLVKERGKDEERIQWVWEDLRSVVRESARSGIDEGEAEGRRSEGKDKKRRRVDGDERREGRNGGEDFEDERGSTSRRRKDVSRNRRRDPSHEDDPHDRPHRSHEDYTEPHQS